MKKMYDFKILDSESLYEHVETIKFCEAKNDKLTLVNLRDHFNFFKIAYDKFKKEYAELKNPDAELKKANAKLKNPDVEFKEVLKAFYKNYDGDKRAWLNYTADIVYAFGNAEVEIWLMEEFDKLNDNEITPYKIIESYREKIENWTGTLDELMKEIAKGTPFTQGYLNKIRKEMNVYKKNST